MPGTRAPYNFVPISGHVNTIPEGERISHDLPYEDGVCGHVDLTLTVMTPVCVGGPRAAGGTVEPLRDVDGVWVLPGSAVRGMLRNVVEIASFSRMGLVERDVRPPVRDLYGRFYTQEMTRTETMDRVKTFTSQVRGGWMRRRADGVTEIEPCRVWRVERSDLVQLLLGQGKTAQADALDALYGGVNPMMKKYAAWQQAGIPLTVAFDGQQDTTVPLSNGRGRLRLSMVRALGSGPRQGTIVFTGQPGARREPAGARGGTGKHREFLFERMDAPAIQVTRRTLEEFEYTHRASHGEKHGGRHAPNAEWGHWKPRFDAGDDVPVFFLPRHGDRIDSIGLAQMFRLPYKHSIGHAIDRVSVDHNPDPGTREGVVVPRVDLAESIFGYVRAPDSGGDALRARCTMGPLRPDGDATQSPIGPFRSVLGQPKPTFYPHYIRQPVDGSGAAIRKREDYRTLMDDDAEIRGWKRYPVRKQSTQRLPEPPNDSVATQWTAIPVGACFRGRIHFHNMRPHEVGAILWALDFGGRTDHWHSLGYARPYGFGAVTLRADELHLRPNAETEDVPTAEVLVGAFTTHMESSCGLSEWSWKDSPQIQALVAMADPEQANHHDLSSMRIDRPNEFAGAKKQKQVLPEYLPIEQDATWFPRQDPANELARRRRASARRLEELETREEATRRASLSPLERAQEDHASKLKDLDDDALIHFLVHELDRTPPPAEDANDPTAWRRALRVVFAPVIQSIEQRAAVDEGAARVASLEQELTAHLEDPSRPKKGRGKDFKRWAKARDRLKKQIEDARQGAQRTGDRMGAYREFLAWLRQDDTPEA